MSNSNTILVTGGLGYIGAITSTLLIEAGYDIVIADNLSNTDKRVLDRIEKLTGVRPKFVELDLIDREGVEQLFASHPSIGGVIHFAAAKAVGESVAKPMYYYRNNLVPLMNLLESMAKHQVNHLVFSSSCTVYGQPDQLPVTEQSPIKPAFSPYGYTKQVNENMLKDATNITPDLSVISLRYFNPIGAHPSGTLGELPKGIPNNLLPFVTQTAIGKRVQLQVFGDDYNTPDGSCIRDYIHVMDLGKAHIIALRRMEQQQHQANFEVFNIGTGKGTSVLELIKSFEKMSGQPLNYKIVARRPGDVEQIWADPSLSLKELGWKPEYSLDEMTQSAWDWEKYLQNENE